MAQLKKILLVDDEKKFLNSIAERLRLMGHDPIKASSGRKALALARESGFDLAIVDLKMPGMNGLEVCRAVRRNDQLTKMKVLITTGHPHHPDL